MLEGSLGILLVDDSAVVRELVPRILSALGEMRVDVAADPIIAIERMKRSRPDVILLDLELPRMSGFAFLQQLMAEDPLPVVVLSGTAPEGSERALRALDLGAVAVVAKPTLGVAGFLHESGAYLGDVLRSAVEVRVRRRRSLEKPDVVAAHARPFGVAPCELPSETIVAIGASTGGPDALREIVAELGSDAPGIVIAQHLPEGVTGALARRLDAESGLSVREATSGEPVLRGHVLVCPGGRHIHVKGRPGSFRVSVESGRPGDRCRPSVDRLFHSVATAAGPAAVGVLLTGMGSDGAEGLGAMRRAGAWSIAEAESSCAVFGMPRRAIERGFVDEVLACDAIAGAILRASARRPGRPDARPGTRASADG